MITLYRPSGYDSPRVSSFAGLSVDDKYNETNDEWVVQG